MFLRDGSILGLRISHLLRSFLVTPSSGRVGGVVGDIVPSDFRIVARPLPPAVCIGNTLLPGYVKGAIHVVKTISTMALLCGYAQGICSELPTVISD